VRTRTALHKALMTLVTKRDYETISVGNIVAEANVGRSTFYTHFNGKDDLLRTAPDELRELLVRHQQAALAEGGHGVWPVGFSLAMFEHAREYRSLRRTLYRGRAGPIMFDTLRRLLAELLRDEIEKAGEAEWRIAVPREFAVQYLVGAFLSVMTWWLDRGAKEPPEEMDAAFRVLALRGLGEQASPLGIGRHPARRQT
jgi:AcrR family transcriptional regulator